MKPLYGEVIVDLAVSSLDRSFSYRIPDALRDQVSIGSAVKVPFGKSSRLVTGCLVNISEDNPYPEGQLKEIHSLAADGALAEKELVTLAAWMKQHHGGTLAQSLKTVMPWRRSVKEQVTRRVRLLLSREEAQEKVLEAQHRHYVAQVRVLDALLSSDETDGGDLIKDGASLIKETKVSLDVLRGLQNKGWIALEEGTSLRKVTEDIAKEAPPILSEAQQEACDKIREEWDGDDRPCLVYGVTGSGKTLVYMEMIQEVLDQGKQAIVLIPEIALTFQTVNRFMKRFGSVVSFLHSRLSDGEKYDQFKAAGKGEIKVMVGPRSALFTPFPNLGLIVIDEEHESSYHSEHMPRYEASDVALKRCQLTGAHLILGSATPSLKAYHAAVEGRYRLVELGQRYGQSTLPDTILVDMRQQLELGNRSILSEPLRLAIEERLAKKEQVMLFLNRRGMTSGVTCRSCGHVEKCPHCDVSLTQHRSGKMICHYCGYEKPAIKACSACGSTLIGGFRVGTEKVEELLEKAFPEAKVLRMDMDTTKGKGGHESILKAFAEGEADILVGTQMIVKGHDYPRVTLVGILLADLSLNDSDYRSGERTFQLVMQAIGRGGRGALKGEAYIQSYDPDHYALIYAAAQDYPGFYREEMLYRKVMHYPPSGHLCAILGSGKNEGLLDQGMSHIRELLKRMDPEGHLETIGPAQPPVGKIKDTHRRVLYIRHDDREVLVKVTERISKYIDANKGFDALHIQYDFNC
ncbi:MAG: primosomal protein N' [Lachnospiraceae bacterium]|nr:primosomal protein N' [Candidatus Equihabitans merdae]